MIFFIKAQNADKYIMTKKLEELFNLDDSEKPKIQEPKEAIEKDEVRSLERSYKEIEKMAGTLPQIDDLETLDEKDLDALAKKAEDAYDDLMDLGMNVEVRYSGRIFEVAGGMLKNAIDAKSAKIDKKLKAVELKLKKLKIDKDAGDDTGEGLVAGQGYIITDRNELLKKLKGEG
jgi:hypothetical protein